MNATGGRVKTGQISLTWYGIYLRISRDPRNTHLAVDRQRTDCDVLAGQRMPESAALDVRVYADNDVTAYDKYEGSHGPGPRTGGANRSRASGPAVPGSRRPRRRSDAVRFERAPGLCGHRDSDSR